MANHLVVFLGSVREGRMATRVLDFVKKVMQNEFSKISVLDPLEIPAPLLKKPLQFHGPGETPPDWLVQNNEIIKNADAFLIITAEYNRCISPPLTNLMDHFPPQSYSHRPAGIVAYSMGPGGGIIAAFQTRQLLGEFGLVSLPFILSIPIVHQTLDAEGNTKDQSLIEKGQKSIKQLKWYADAMKQHKTQNGNPY